MNKIIKYSDGEIELKVSIDSETIWLIAEDIASLFGVQRPAVVKHIGNIYKDEELLHASTCSILEQLAKDGKTRKINFYNLDIVISVGYRVNSKKATKFRQWATTVLKEYISNGYAVNTHKITEKRLLNLETDMQEVKSHIKNNSLDIKQGIFYNGQIYDAYAFVNDLLKSAKKDVILIDNYIDDTIFTLCSKYPNINFKIYTHTINKPLKLDYEKYKKQYKNIELKEIKDFHDRFLIIDNSEIYHLGASLKDLGNKVFAFSKLNIGIIALSFWRR